MICATTWIEVNSIRQFRLYNKWHDLQMETITHDVNIVMDRCCSLNFKTIHVLYILLKSKQNPNLWQSFTLKPYLSFSLTCIFLIQFTNSMILHNFTVRDAINLSVPLTRIGNDTSIKYKGSPFIHSIPLSSWWYALWGRNHEPTSFKLFIS